MSRHRGAKPCRRDGLWARSACYPGVPFCPSSDGPPKRCRLITGTGFLPARAAALAVSPACALAPVRPVADRPEPNFAAPPLPFGRRPPQSNYPPGAVPPPGQAGGWGPGRRGRHKGRRLPGAGAPGSQPPAYPLYATPWHPRQAAVKVHGSFRPSAGRPSSPAVQFRRAWSRQRPGRCAFRAGRNLPDKEFRATWGSSYAAVYRGLASPLRVSADLARVTFRHRAGVRLTRRLSPQQSPVLLVNSRLGLLSLRPSGGAPFPGYGAILPSSDHGPPACPVCSTSPPVSVSVRARATCPAAFLGPPLGRLRQCASPDGPGASAEGLASRRPGVTTGASRTRPGLRPASRRSVVSRAAQERSLAALAYGSCLLGLGSRLTLGDEPSQETSGSARGFPPRLATRASILTPARPRRSPAPASPRAGSPYRCAARPHPAAARLARDCRRLTLGPRAVTVLTGGCFWANVRGCLRVRTSLATRLRLGGLGGRSGLFPSRARNLAPAS